jgi:hypothetical protein
MEGDGSNSADETPPIPEASVEQSKSEPMPAMQSNDEDEVEEPLPVFLTPKTEQT